MRRVLMKPVVSFRSGPVKLEGIAPWSVAPAGFGACWLLVCFDEPSLALGKGLIKWPQTPRILLSVWKGVF